MEKKQEQEIILFEEIWQKKQEIALLENEWQKKQEIALLENEPLTGFFEFRSVSFKIQKLETEINEHQNKLNKLIKCHHKLKTY